MNEQTTSSSTDPNSVRKAMNVKAPIEVAWRVFTEKMGEWWPLAQYKIGKADAVDAIVEPRVGGRWYERGKDGSTCDWGSVLVWEPPSRLVLTWDINADFEVRPGQVWLSDAGKRKAISLFENRLGETWKHPHTGQSLTWVRIVELECRLLEKEWTGCPDSFARLRLR